MIKDSAPPYRFDSPSGSTQTDKTENGFRPDNVPLPALIAVTSFRPATCGGNVSKIMLEDLGSGQGQSRLSESIISFRIGDFIGTELQTVYILCKARTRENGPGVRCRFTARAKRQTESRRRAEDTSLCLPGR
jgi:hypothetical protein